jgi:hypothetical protein
MELFQKTQDCPKCGSKRFVCGLDSFSADFVPMKIAENGQEVVPEHMSITYHQAGVNGCGYTFKEQCADAE